MRVVQGREPASKPDFQEGRSVHQSCVRAKTEEDE